MRKLVKVCKGRIIGKENTVGDKHKYKVERQKDRQTDLPWSALIKVGGGECNWQEQSSSPNFPQLTLGHDQIKDWKLCQSEDQIPLDHSW